MADGGVCEGLRGDFLCLIVVTRVCYVIVSVF